MQSGIPPLKLTSAACSALLIACGGAPMASALEYNWDTSATAGLQAGSGLWGTDAFWTTDGSTLGGWPGSSHTATFGGTGTSPFTIQLSGNQTVAAGSAAVGGLNFTSTGYTLRGDASAREINIGSGTNTRIIRVANGVEATIGIRLTVGNTSTGSGPVNVVGGGILNVTGTSAILRQNAANSIIVNGVSGSATKLVAGTGGLVTSAGSIVIGNDAFDAELEVHGGTVNSTASSGNIVISNSTGTGKITLSSGNMTVSGTTGGIRFGAGTTTTAAGEFNLNGGILTVGKIYEGNSGQTSTFNFNGGTLKVLGASGVASNFMEGLNTVNVRNNGAIIDTNGLSATILQNLSHSNIGGDDATDGGLTKKGTGTLTLSGTNSYTGKTTIMGGTLLANSAAAVPSGTALDLSGGTFATNQNSISLGSLTHTASSVIDMGSGTTVMTFADSAANAWAGTLSVWNWTGSLSGGGSDQLQFSSAGLTSGQLASVSFLNPAGLPAGTYGATFVGNELVPVPEPGALLTAAVLAAHTMQRRRRPSPSPLSLPA